jgi:hypothetical protein
MKCKHLFVPKDVCGILFTKKKEKICSGFDGTQLIKNKNGKYVVEGKTFFTVRDEQVILNFNKKGEIIYIELLGSPKAKKPCQSS